jgi:hypothetical protein
MSIENPNLPKRKGAAARPLLRAEIEEAQRHTNSNHAAARWLGVSYQRYKTYAKLYGIFEQHLNPSGFGIEKGWAKRPSSIRLQEILDGKHPTYSLAKLKNRLLARKKLQPRCSLCGFSEARITDKQVPLMLIFKDNNRKNFQLENLDLLCYNCIFLTTGAPNVIYRSNIQKSLSTPDAIKPHESIPPTSTDALDLDDQMLDQIILTPEERRALLADLSSQHSF